MATARSASTPSSKPGLAETLATRLPTKTRSEKSSLSDASVDSTLPRRTATERERPRTTTASAASAPAFRARWTRSSARASNAAESISSVMIWPSFPSHLLCSAGGIKGSHLIPSPFRKAKTSFHGHVLRNVFAGPAAAARRRRRLRAALQAARSRHRSRLSRRRRHHRPIAAQITEGEEILHVAELGVVFLLFIIGLELKPSRLWQMRRDIFGSARRRLLITGAALSALGFYCGLLNWRARSSQASALPCLPRPLPCRSSEKSDINTRYGQRAFSVLLLQTWPSCRCGADPAPGQPGTGGEDDTAAGLFHRPHRHRRRRGGRAIALNPLFSRSLPAPARARR